MNSFLGNFQVRIGFVVGIVVLTHVGLIVARTGNAPPKVMDPTGNIEDLPMELGDWRGEDVELDPRQFSGSEARRAVSRVYTRQGQKVSVFLAFYDNPTAALYHNPGNCYRSSGWSLMQSSTAVLPSGHRPQQIEVRVTDWRRQGENAVVFYWYEAGDLTLFAREDIWHARWAFRGRKMWPPIFKVLIQATSNNSDLARKEAQDLAEKIHDWLGEITPQAEASESSSS